MNLRAAHLLAQKVVEGLQPHCSRIEIAGSIRRQRAEVNDIDLVLVPLNGIESRGDILERCQRTCTPVTGCDISSQNSIFKFGNGFQLDLFFAHDRFEDLLQECPSNCGAVLLCRTGSQRHNVQLCQHALSKRLKFMPYVGVTDGENILGGDTEPSIYEALGLDYREPTERETL